MCYWFCRLYMIVFVPVTSFWHSCHCLLLFFYLNWRKSISSYSLLHSLLLCLVSHCLSPLGSCFISAIQINSAEKKPYLHFKDSAGCQQLAAAIKKPSAGCWWCICCARVHACLCVLKMFSSGANWILFQQTDMQQHAWNKNQFSYNWSRPASMHRCVTEDKTA